MKEGVVEVRSLHRDRTGNPPKLEWFATPAAAIAYAPELEALGYDVYFGVCKRVSTGGANARSVLGATALWVDLDAAKMGWDTALCTRTVQALPPSLRPTSIVRSGGGLHLYWVLAKPLRMLSDVVALNKRLATAFAGDNVGDVARIMRLPGTRNFKYDGDVRCEVVQHDGKRTFDPSTLVAAVEAHGLVFTGDAFPAPEVVERAAVASSSGGKFPYPEYSIADRIATYWGEDVRMGAVHGFDGADVAIARTTAFCHGKGYPDSQIVDAVWEYLVKRAAADRPGLVLDEKAERRKIKDKLDRYKPKKVQRDAGRDAERKAAANPFAGLKVAPVPGWFNHK
jgi:RepB DNA-primase from phage plasmid